MGQKTVHMYAIDSGLCYSPAFCHNVVWRDPEKSMQSIKHHISHSVNDILLVEVDD